jgi:hypothetical protein
MDFVELHDAECEILPRIVAVEGGSYRGHDGLRAYLRDMRAAFTDWVPDCSCAPHLSRTGALLVTDR